MTEPTKKNDKEFWELLDVSRVDSGVYQVRIGSANGQVMESKIRVTLKEITANGGIGSAAFDSEEFERTFRSANIPMEQVVRALLGPHYEFVPE
jgi:hypothetical protein